MTMSAIAERTLVFRVQLAATLVKRISLSFLILVGLSLKPAVLKTKLHSVPEVFVEGLEEPNTRILDEQPTNTTRGHPERKTRPLTWGGCLILFVSVLSAEFAPLSILWSFTIAATNVTENDLPMYTYVLTEMLIGILAPMLVIISGVLAAMIADYTTSGKVDPRDLISYILPSVTLFKGMNHCYWVIVDTFYFVTKKTKVQNYQGRCHWCSALDKSLVTCGLAAIVSLALMESFSTFASINVSVMVSYSSCETADIDISVFTCYDGKTWQNVNNCSLENGTSHIFCFQFVPARSVGTHSLDSLVASILVYVGFTHLFGLTFTVIGALLRCKATKVWGVIVVLVGITIFLCGFVQFILIFYYPVKYKPNETVQTNMLGIYIVVTGTLLMRIKWMEKPDDDKEVELHSIRLPKAERYRNVRATRRAKFSPDTEQFDCTTEKDTAGRPRNHLTVA